MSLLVTIPICLYRVTTWSRVYYLKFMTVFITLNLIFLKVLPQMIIKDLLKNEYQITAIINPLSYIMKKSNGDASLMNLEIYKKSIESIVSLQDLIMLQHDLEIPVYHTGKVKIELDQNELMNVFIAYLQIIKNNLGLFFENRINLFSHMTGLKGNWGKLSDDLMIPKETQPTFIQELISEFKLKKSPGSVFLQQQQNLWIIKLEGGSYGSFLNVFFATALLGIFFMLLGLVLFLHTPLFSCICIMILMRTLTVFLLAPAPQFKYIYSLYLFGFVAPILLISELKLWDSKLSTRGFLQVSKFNNGSD